ncbi:MAG: AMP-binding protein [Aquiluna sp.]|nr:AMP-binding protein [Aquiluna sp.]MCF8545532.1 AMP-binding protein [Aquiluna sp.]
MKKLQLIAANDTFRALQLLIEVWENKTALFITPPEINGLMPEVHGLPDQVGDDLALIVESSGSTGAPKRIEISISALKHSIEASAQRLGGHGQWLLALPINFIAGVNVLLRSIAADTQPVMLNSRVPFSADGFLRAASLMTGDKRFTSLVPLQLERLVESLSDAYSLALLRRFDAILVGGQSLNQTTKQLFLDKGVKIIESYGMTETCGGCVYDGAPLSGVEISLDAGRIAISGPVLANGLGQKFVTSDLGSFSDGTLTVLGRSDRVIISGGLKVSLDRVEAKALDIPGLQEVSAVALDSEYGESVGLVYVGEDLSDFSSLRELGVAAMPAKTMRVNSMPLLPSGKPDLIEIKKLIAG